MAPYLLDTSQCTHQHFAMTRKDNCSYKSHASKEGLAHMQSLRFVGDDACVELVPLNGCSL